MSRFRRALRRIRVEHPGMQLLRPGAGAVAGLFCLILLLTAGQAGGQATAQLQKPDPASWQPTSAENEAVAELLAETEVETSPDRPSWGRYGLDLGKTLAESFFSWMDRSLDFGGLPSLDFRLMARIFLVLVGLLLAIWLGTYLYRRLSQPSAPQRSTPSPMPQIETPVPREAGGWRQELERNLSAGDLREALEALWWWLARSLAGSRADPSWTSGDLLRHTRRRDLRGPLALLDTLRYGTDGPLLEGAGSELRALVRRFDQILTPPGQEPEP